MIDLKVRWSLWPGNEQLLERVGKKEVAPAKKKAKKNSVAFRKVEIAAGYAKKGTLDVFQCREDTIELLDKTSGLLVIILYVLCMLSCLSLVL